MRLSDQILNAMNDIDESLLEASEQLEEKKSFSWKKALIIASSFVLALVIILPFTNSLQQKDALAPESVMEESKTDGAYESNSATVTEDSKSIGILTFYSNGKWIRDIDITEKFAKDLEAMGIEVVDYDEEKIRIRITEAEFEQFKFDCDFDYTLEITQ